MFKKVPKEYRPIPFWSWNEKLETEETRRQVEAMDEAGMGGFFMHARGGLQTEYMGGEWFENVSAAADESKGRGMRAWAYDENGWPSGFGGGRVNGRGVGYQQKYLRMEDGAEHTATSICTLNGHHFYYDVNPFYVDTLDKKVVRAFIEEIYQPYYEKYGNEIEGFFTDEPQISRNGIPWSFVFEEEYKDRYGDELTARLDELFLPVGEYKTTRFRFWKMVTELFSAAYMKQIYDWCTQRGLKLTGHLVLEETLKSQLTSNGACMPHYEYFHIPGMDWLGRNIFDCLTIRQLSSAAEQLGKSSVLSETFALCGHNVSFDELKGIYEWQLVRGVNLLCQHLEGYSIRGIRKRDYPPAMYKQQPWWGSYRIFVDAMSREGMLLSGGECRAKILLIHPMSTAWTRFDNGKCSGLDELNSSFLRQIKTLEQKQLLFHLGDETIMERHARVEDGQLVIGAQKYDTVILPEHEILFPSTKELLAEFERAGGKIVSENYIPAAEVTDCKELAYTKREYENFTVHYFVNSSKNSPEAEINVSGEALDITTGETAPFGGRHVFEPWGSLMLIENGAENSAPMREDCEYISPEGEFEVGGDMLNVITLDRCDYYFDGVLCEKNGYVLNICERANALERRVRIHQDYFADISFIPSELYLICETPEKFEISVNGIRLCAEPCGSFADNSFKKIDIADYVKTGRNTISFDIDFEQSERFYQELKNARVFESEKNKLSYDIEIEAIYLLGKFGVKTDGKWTEINEGCDRYSGGFEIVAPPSRVTLQNLQRQGFPFFCGSLVLKGELDVKSGNARLVFNKRGVNAVTVGLGGHEKTALWGNEIDISGMAAPGRSALTLTLTNNLHNMLGPHHLKAGETLTAAPSSFYKEPCVWSSSPEKGWDDDYCFVKFGLYLQGEN